jgi:3-methyladenine DNA glycosylase AlkD
MHKIIKDIRAELIKNSDPERKKSGEKFFRENVNLHGVRAALLNQLSKAHYAKIHEKNKDAVFNLCEELWKSQILEESIIACFWSYNVHKQYLPEDFDIFEKWVNEYVSNWATCDTLCNHSVGTLLEMYPEKIKQLIKWTASENRWMRRAASVSLIVPAKRGKFLNEIFEISGILMMDKDDMVQKGYGWMLKVASEVHLKDVYDFVISHKGSMPRTAYRYAIEKMPPELKEKAMKK